MKNANDQLREYTGTSQWYRHPLSGLLFTDGIKGMADTFQAWWLVDLILSHQRNPNLQTEPFQTWQLQRLQGDQFEAVATDGNKRRLAHQHIPFSDFDADCITLYVCDGVLLLPSEY